MTNSKRMTIKDLMVEIEKLKAETQEVESLRKRIIELEKNVQSLKSQNEYQSGQKTPEKIVSCKKCVKTFCTVNDLKKHVKSKHALTEINCNSCESVFFKNSELEIHLEKEHQVEKFKCEICDKTFALEWRLAKHQNMHTSKNIQKCHYFNNKKTCPFEQIGCMFDHSSAGECRYGKSCKIKLCSFEHKTSKTEENKLKDDKDTPKETNDEIEMTDEEKSFDLYVKVNFPDILSNYLENDRTIHCYYCSYKTKSKILRNIEDEVYKHLKTMHLEIFNAFKNDEIIFDNNWHEEFLGFFGSD